MPSRLLSHVCGCHVCWVIVHIPPATEDTSVFEVISRIFPGFLTDLPGHWLTFTSGPSSGFYYLGHYNKNRDWLIGWQAGCRSAVCAFFKFINRLNVDPVTILQNGRILLNLINWTFLSVFTRMINVSSYDIIISYVICRIILYL